MLDLIDINPEFDKLSNISPAQDITPNDKQSIKFEKSKYEFLKKLCSEYKIDIPIDNLCFIVTLLEQEKIGVDIVIKHTDLRKKLDIDRLEVSKFLKAREKNHLLVINTLKFEYAEYTLNESTPKKLGSFEIVHPNIIEQVSSIIWKAYKYQSSTDSDYKAMLKKNKKNQGVTNRCKLLAHSLYSNLTQNTLLGENKKYFLIGYLFQYVGIETGISEDDFNQIINSTHYTHYKNYQEYVSKNIRAKYFKGGRKTIKK